MAGKRSTKEILFDTFFEFSQTKRLDDLTIADILNHSGISRSTFYRYFTDKYDLMSQFYQHQIAMLYQKNYCESESAWCIQKKVSYETAKLYYANQEFFANILVHEGQNSFTEASINHGIGYYKNLFKKGGWKEVPADLLFAIEYHCIAATEMLNRWVRSGFKLTPEEYCGLLFQTVPETLRENLTKCMLPQDGSKSD